MTKNVNSIQSEIEDSIQRQDIEKSEKHIRTLLKTDKYSVDSRLLASEYYRRLSLYVRSMQVLQCNKDPIDLDHPSVSDVRLYLQYARLRNSLGGSKFALLIINKLKINQKIQFSKLVGPILLSNYKYQDAYPIYKKVDSELSDHSDYPTRVHYLGLIDTLTGLKDYKNATDCLNRIEQISKEPLLKGILCEIRGSILLMTGNYKEALNVLNSALNYFPENTKTVDLGYLYKWIGASLVCLGDYTKADQELTKSWELLYRPGFKPEIWLEVLFWKGLLHFKLQPNEFPIQWKQILLYPKPDNYFQERILKYTAIPKELVFTGTTTDLTIYLSQDILCKYENNKDQYYLFLSKTEQLLAYLSSLSPYGIPQFRIYDQLWSGEWLSESLHKKRFEQVLILARKKLPNLNFIWKDLHLWLDSGNSKDTPQVIYSTNGNFRGAVFFQKALSSPNEDFTLEDVGAFFNVSRSPARKLLNEWLSEKLIKLESRGKYKLISGLF